VCTYQHSIPAILCSRICVAQRALQPEAVLFCEILA